MRRCLAFALAILTGVALAPVSAPAASWAEGSDPPWSTCAKATVPVTVSPTDPTVYTVYGRLCLGNDALRGQKTVQLFVSGLTYDHNYFNVATSPNVYSYVYAATNAG